ncbi:MAG TPA: translesion DNA synthesis-associated protein ImuA [Gallionellaceae bacterium]|nr:translesion DNA synthesis-associated protein ImuA [Gallionellaceae bacterium]
MNASLHSLLQHPGIWRGDQLAQTSEGTLPTGFAELDELLPGGGWPCGALTEILLEREGIGELQLLLPALARVSEQNGWLAWVAPPHIPYAPALAAAGVRLHQLLVAKPESAADAWWTAEQALRSGACSAVLAWLKTHDERRMRRLQLGAESGRAWGILFRSASAAQERSTAALRLRLQATPHGLAVHILKRRGGQVSKPVLLDLHQTHGVRRARPSAPSLSVVQFPREAA